MTLTRGFVRNAVTTPLDARLMDMAKIVGNADGSPRTGVLNGGGGAIVTTTANTGPMTVNVSIAEFATSKGRADGVSIFTNDGTVSVPIGAAPGSNSRIDVIWVKHNDDTTGDANANPVFGVTAGVAAGSPVPSAIPTGAEELAQLRVYAGTTASNGGSNTLVNTYKMTAARGGVVPFRTAADMALWTNPVVGQLATVLGDTSANPVYRWNGTAWKLTASLFLGLTSVTPAAQTGITAETLISSASLTVDVPRTGRIRLTAAVQTFSSNTADVLVLRLKEGATTRAEFTAAANSSPSAAATSVYHQFSVFLSGVTAGSHTYTLAVIRAAGSGTITVSPSATSPTQLSAEAVD